jgi:protocatechuate 3,4-dioxygenase beta subunit
MLSSRSAFSWRAMFARATFVCAGLLALAPLSDCDLAPAADPPAANPPKVDAPAAAKAKPKPQPRARRPRPPLLPSSLTGRITDETGAPVTDAELQIYPKQGGRVYMAKTKPDGSYAFDRVPDAGAYRLSIFSNRCISLSDYEDERLEIPLDPPHTVTRNFVLKPGCQLKLKVVDEEGHPLPKVSIYKPGRYDGKWHSTAKDGTATVGGMAPSPQVVRFAFHHEDYALGSLDIKLDDTKKIVEREITLTKGKTVEGTVICSDGKPPVGSTIQALPSWWDYMSSPSGLPIRADGSFTLPHIGLGAYKISVSIPRGPSSWENSPVMSDVDLFDRKEPLALKTNFPSPGKTGTISGRIHFKGNRPKEQGFWISANGTGRRPGNSMQYVQPNDTTFNIGPIPDGRYELTINSREYDMKRIPMVATGTNDVVLEITAREPVLLKGRVLAGKPDKPLTNLRVRVIRTQGLGGRNEWVDPSWHSVSDPHGAFSVEISGPGVYVVEASADGYAITKSAPANTAVDPKQEVRVTLAKGLSLSGTVVDEAGRPINGATVLARSTYGRPLPASAAKVLPGANPQTTDGRFRFENLSPGTETIRALHPDYVFAEVKDIELKADATPAPLRITLKHGGTIRGRVYNQSGRPAPGVRLQFLDRQFNDYRGTGEFATAISDEAGEYEISHLPDSLVYIIRHDGWTAEGVIRQAVRPAPGKSLRVDFGGIKKVTGRLLLNGKPVANTRVVLADEPNNGIFEAATMTDDAGNFVFRGVPPGERTLYYTTGTGNRQRTSPVKPLVVQTSNDAFGTLDLTTVTLRVHVSGRDDKGQSGRDGNAQRENLILWPYDPVWFYHGSSRNAEPPQGKNDPFVFRDVPVGKYRLTFYRSPNLGVRHEIEITGPKEQTITLEVPKGTAAVSGTLKPSGPESGRYIELRSKDNRLFASKSLTPEERFEFDGLPAGDYYFTQQGVIAADKLGEVTLAAGEKKTIALSDAPSSHASGRGFLHVCPFTTDGLPLPGCRIRLTGPKGDVPVQSSQFGRTAFTAEPGKYQLSVAFPGFVPTSQPVEVKAAQNGRFGPEHEVDLTLQRATDQPQTEAR